MTVNGFLVALGPNGQIDVGDGVAVSQSTFTIAETLGTGRINFSGSSSSGSSSATFYRGTDGNIYAGNAFIPSSPPQTSAVVNTFTPAVVPDGIVDGSSGDDYIDDSFIDLQGDRITSGNDSIVAGAGNDRIMYSNGADTVFGGAGNDTIDGGGSGSILYGGDGNDLISVGSANVTAYGDAGNDTIFGVTGNETTYGGDGNDYFFLYSGNDVAFGGTGSDTIFGEEGADTISGGTGADSLLGGQDADTFLIEDGFGADTITGGEGATTGTDFDRINFSALTTGVTVTYSGFEAGSATNGTDTLNFTQIEALTLTNQADVVIAPNDTRGLRINAGGGNDSIQGGLAADSILGGAGNDTLSGGSGADTIDGGAGDDIIGGFENNEGNDLFRGGDGADSILGGGGNDTLFGDAGSDTLTGGVGNDTLYGGDDGDKFSIGDDHEGEVIFGGEGGIGNDTLSLFNFAQTTGVNVTYTGSEIGTYSFNTGTGTGSFSEIETLWTTDNGDIINAGSATTGVIIDARGGADSIIGGAGADWLQGGDGADTIYGNGTSADNAADTIVADGGDDDIILGSGDLAYGGSGDDIFYLFTNQGTGGTATIYGGEGGEDASDPVNGGEGDGLRLEWNGVTTVSHNYTITFSGSEAGSVTGGATNVLFHEIEWITTGAGRDTIDASADSSGMSFFTGDGNDSMIGGSGADFIDGGAGSDRLRGGAGNDTIQGGSGRDFIYGGTGNDILLGGSDGLGDYFYLEANYGNDTIIDEDNRAWINASTGTVTSDLTAIFSANYIGTLSGIEGTVSFQGVETILTDSGNDLLDASATTSDVYLHAGGGNNTVIGGAGNDDLRGGSGNDSLVGGAGNDYFETHGGNDTVIGGAGNDFLDSFGEASGSSLFFDAGSGNDTLYTLNTIDVALLGIGDDVAYSGAGADTINAGGGADTIYTEADADLIEIEDGFNGTQIFGGEGITTGTDFDRLDFSNMTTGIAVTFSGNETGSVTSGTDTLSFAEIEALTLTAQSDSVDATATTAGQTIDGMAGDDTIFGGAGGDTISGGDGDDLIDGGAGDDFLTTGLGNDTLIGGDGNDTLMNSDGDDSLDGGAGDDSIIATGGRDTLRGGTGADTMAGGDDADTFIIEDNFGNDIITGGEGASAGGSDEDVIDLSALTRPVTVTYSGPEAGTITDGTDTITFSQIERLILTDQADVVNATANTPGAHIDGGGGDDSIAGSTAGDDTLFGGDGNDTLRGWNGSDSLDGGAGDDFLIGDTGNDTLIGGSGNDTIALWTEDDRVEGGDDADLIQVYSLDNDTIFGGEGTTTGIDFDTIDLSALSGTVTVTYTGNEAGTITNGTRTITFAEIERLILTSRADVVNAGADSVGIVIDAGAGNDRVIGGSGNDSILGGAGNDTLDGGWGNDTLEGGDGADTLRGGGGNDVLSGGASNDRLEGGAGNDTLIGGDGNDSLFGGSDNDSLEGGAGNDSLDSSSGNDTLRGGSGNDTLANWAGADLLDGGDDTDTFLIGGTGFAGTTVTGGEGGVDNDTLNLSALTGPVTVTYADDEAGTIASGSDTLSFSQIEELTLTNHADRVIISDGASPMAINAGGGDDSVTGIRSGQIVDGGTGNDTLIGEANDSVGISTLSGGAGDDFIDGGDRADLIYGGDGNDRIEAGEENSFGDDDTIYGGAGDDTITSVETHSGSNDLIFGEGGNDSINVTGGDANLLDGGAGNDTIVSGTGNDTLTGGTGNDRLTGGAGNDVFTFAAGDGADTITDFNFGNTGALGDEDTANNDFINLSAFYDRLSELRADFSDDGILNQSNSTTAGGNVDYSDNDRMQSGDGITFQDASRSSFRTDNTGVVCFGSGTRILTPSGEVMIENLRAGDLVVTRDNGPQRIAWIGHRPLRRDELARSPKLRPVWISPQLSGANASLIVSPQHGLVFDFEGEERLIRATHLAATSGGGARIMRGCREVTYHHVMFEAHEIIFANGAPSESFFPGPWALHALEPEALQEVVSLFPDLTCQSGRSYGLTARSFVPGRQLPDTLRALSSVSA